MKLSTHQSTGVLNSWFTRHKPGYAYMDTHTLSARLRMLIKQLDLSINAFCDQIGVKQGTMMGYINDNREPGYTFIAKILAKYPAVNPDWLVRGKGEMWRDATTETELKRTYELEILRTKVDMLEESVTLYKRLLANEKPPQKKNHHRGSPG